MGDNPAVLPQVQAFRHLLPLLRLRPTEEFPLLDVTCLGVHTMLLPLTHELVLHMGGGLQRCSLFLDDIPRVLC